MNTYANTDTLMGAALAPLDWTRSFGLVIVFSLFIAACAQFTIPLGDVPITGQTFAVLLTGALLGSRLGAAAVIAYLIEGAVGLPFFAGGFAEHGWDKRYHTAAIAMAIGSVVILATGWAWYTVITNTPPNVSFQL